MDNDSFCGCSECERHNRKIAAATNGLRSRVWELERLLSVLETTRIDYIRRDGGGVQLIETDCGAMVTHGDGRTVLTALEDAARRLDDRRNAAVNGLPGQAETRVLPTAAELTGSDPDFAGDLSTDEYIRSIRRD